MIMKIRSFKYHLKQGSKNVFKNELMSIASIISVAICSFIFIFSLNVILNLNTALKNLEKSLGVSVYLGDDVTDEEIEYLYTKLSDVANILEISYMSKEDALEWAKEEWGDEQNILDGFEYDNPFPRSFEITINGAKYQSQVIKDLTTIQKEFEKIVLNNRQDTLNIENTEGTEITEEYINSYIEDIINQDGYTYVGIEKIKHTQTEAEILLKISKAIRWISVIVVFILSIVSIVIIFNTIKLTVYVRKAEINIMKYVGATDWFIKWPFVFEGIIIGLIGAFIPVVISAFSYTEIVYLVYEKLPIVKSYIEFKSTADMVLITAPTTILLGAILGIIGSTNSVKKYLNV